MMRWYTLRPAAVQSHKDQTDRELRFEGVPWLVRIPSLWRFYSPRAVIWVENKGRPYHAVYRSHPDGANESAGRSMWSIDCPFVAVRIGSGPVNFSFVDDSGRLLFARSERGQNIKSLFSTKEVREQYPYAKLI